MGGRETETNEDEFFCDNKFNYFAASLFSNYAVCSCSWSQFEVLYGCGCEEEEEQQEEQVEEQEQDQEERQNKKKEKKS